MVSSDRVRKVMAGIAPTARGDAALYTAAAVAGNYGEVLGRARAVLESGRGVILDATFSSLRRRQEAAELARSTGAALVFVETRCADPRDPRGTARGAARAAVDLRRDGRRAREAARAPRADRPR